MKLAHKVAAAILLALPAVASAASSPSSSSVGVGTLEQRVVHELRSLPYYSVFDELNFTVTGDRVTLTGEVTNPIVKIDAVNAVKHLVGANSVDDQIEVLPLSDFDRNIRLKTYFAIYGFGPLEKYGLGTQPSIHILVKDGHVRLAGVVNSKADSDVAFLRANSVPGVFSVSNDLRVERP
jgi:hyperosmotically inducible periplasmic protein